MSTTQTDVAALVTAALEQRLRPDIVTGETHSVVVDDHLDDRTVRATLWDDTGDDGSIEVAIVTLTVTSIVMAGEGA